MTIKLERIISEDEETNKVKIFYKIRKSFIRSLLLTQKELIELKRLIKIETEGV